MPSSLGAATALALIVLAAPSIPDTQQLTLSPSVLMANDSFGGAVAISGKLVIVGAVGDDEEGSAAGHAYILKQGPHNLWTFDGDLLPAELDAGDIFGQSVDIDAKSAIVGAPADDDGGEDAGAVYLFTRRSNGWTSAGKVLQFEPQAGAYFGDAVAISGNSAIVAAPRWHQTGQVNSGAFTILVKARDGSWDWDIGSFGQQNDGTLGASVAMSGKIAVVGAPGEDSTGAAHLVALDQHGWNTAGTLHPTGSNAGEHFGASVATDGKLIIVGAPDHIVATHVAGAAYVFRREGNSWIQEDILVRSAVTENTRFGSSVAISGKFAIVGAPGDSLSANAAGSVYLFQRQTNGAWTQYGEPLLQTNPQASDNFGASVDLEKSNAIIGEPGYSGVGGAAYFR